MVAFWQWLTVIALAATPALVLGQSGAAAAAIKFGFDPVIAVPVIALSGFAEALVVARLANASTRIGFINRWCVRIRTPRAVGWAKRWGPWGGMTLGVAAVGQEPILLALRWLGVDMRKLIVPAAVSNAVFAVLYYVLVWKGLDWTSML